MIEIRVFPFSFCPLHRLHEGGFPFAPDFNVCKEDASPKPEYTVHSGDIMIKFTASENRVIRSVTATVTEKITEKEQQLLNLILEDPAYTSQEMADKPVM